MGPLRAVTDRVSLHSFCSFIVGKQFNLTSHSGFIFCASYFSPETGHLGCRRFFILLVDCSQQVLSWYLRLGPSHFHILCISLIPHHLIIQLSVVSSYWQHCRIDKDHSFLRSVDRTSRYMHVMKPTWCTIYLQFVQSLYLYMFRAC
jgi:hypothetical protein